MMTTTHTISVPQATVNKSQGAQPYTQYHVTLQLPLRKVEVLKRFSQFEALHLSLKHETKLTPPVALPPKSWFRRTVSSTSLTEDRRVGLEQYVRAIVEAEDKRWRTSLAWRSFLNPAGNVTSPSTPLHGDRQDLDDTFINPSAWLEQHRELKVQMQNVRHQLKQKEAANTTSQQHVHAADAKVSLVRAAVLIARLESGLNHLNGLTSEADKHSQGEGSILGTGELRRRRDLLVAAKSEVEGLENMLNTKPVRHAASTVGPSGGISATDRDKDGLWGSSSITKPAGRVLGGTLKESKGTQELGNSGVLQLQQQILKDQDEDVLALGKTVARLKDMGIMINEELVIQNEMLGLLEEDTDRVQGKITVAKRRIENIK